MATVMQEQPTVVDNGKRVSSEYDHEKNVTQGHSSKEVGENASATSDVASEDFQGGVKRVRAITTVWTVKTLVLMFVLLYFVSFVDALTVSVQGSLNPYITSAFHKHGLLTSTGVVSSLISGCSSLTLAKVVDVWGRVEGFLFMLLIVVIGLIMKAVAPNMETYVAAHTLYWTGHIGMLYVIDVMIADMTTLKNRLLIMTINGTPTIASTFLGPLIAEEFLLRHNFRWAYGAFAIVFTAVCIPVVTTMIIMYQKAKKLGEVEKTVSGRNWHESIWYHLIQFDVVGILLVTAAFALILLPFSIATYAPNGWATGYIIAMIVLGVLLLPAFFAWEKYLAPVQFLPWVYLLNPTILGSCALYGAMFVSVFSWNSLFGSYLQVVHRLDVATSGYVLNAFSLSSAILSPLFGLLISKTGDFKWTAYAGVPILLLGTALLIPFRQPDTPVAVLVVTQVLCGIGTGLFATCSSLAVQVPVTHQEVAAVLAVNSMFGGIGAGIGMSVAGAIWNNLFPKELLARLPEDTKDRMAEIYGDIVVQMSFEDGTPERDAIVGAYASVQRKMVIAGACFVPLCLLSIFVWKNTNVRKLEEEKGKQMKGVIF